MLKRLIMASLMALGCTACATPSSDPFNMQQRIERANNPFLHVEADPSQRLTNGDTREFLRGDAEFGAFEVPVGDSGAGLRQDNRRLLEDGGR